MFLRKCDVFKCGSDAYKTVRIGGNEYALCAYHQPMVWKISHQYVDRLTHVMREFDDRILNLPPEDGTKFKDA